MNRSYHFEYCDEPLPADIAVLTDGLSREAFLKKEMPAMQSFGIFIKNAEGLVLGGACGFTYYGCLYIDALWIEKSLRQQGLGRKLIEKSEALGLQRSCLFSTVNTMDWEALDFYQHLDYEIEFVREGYLKDSKLYFLRKAFKPHSK